MHKKACPKPVPGPITALMLLGPSYRLAADERNVHYEELMRQIPYPAARKSLIKVKLYIFNSFAIALPSEIGQCGIFVVSTVLFVTGPAIPTTPTTGKSSLSTSYRKFLTHSKNDLVCWALYFVNYLMTILF